mgnify:CR=1 FL=1|jgi:hypothetical protein
MEVFFNIHHNFKNLFSDYLKNAKYDIKVMMCWVTDPCIISYINDAIKRGVSVELIVSKKHNKNLMESIQSECKITFIDGKLFHHKTLIIDNRTIITGSCNFHKNSISGRDMEYIIKYELNNEECDYYGKIFRSYATGGEFPQSNLSYLENNKILFSENTDILNQILNELETCKHELTIMHFWMTNQKICEKIVELSNRNVKINILLDKRSHIRSEQKFKSLLFLDKHGVDVNIIVAKLFHYKIILIDNDKVLCGSQNLYSTAFTHHFEDLTIYKSSTLNYAFRQHYNWLMENKECIPTGEWELLSVCKKYNIKKEDVCIVGSYILQKNKIRQSHDVDFIVKKSERTKINERRGTKKITNITELVSINWHPTLSDDEIISNNTHHTILKSGFKIIKLELLVDRKNKTRRPKDINDLKLIEEFKNDK